VVHWIKTEIKIKIVIMNLYDTKDFFFMRSNGIVAPGIETLVIEKATTCITI